jgi:hypothetical protein
VKPSTIDAAYSERRNYSLSSNSENRRTRSKQSFIFTSLSRSKLGGTLPRVVDFTEKNVSFSLSSITLLYKPMKEEASLSSGLLQK